MNRWEEAREQMFGIKNRRVAVMMSDQFKGMIMEESD